MQDSLADIPVNILFSPIPSAAVNVSTVKTTQARGYLLSTYQSEEDFIASKLASDPIPKSCHSSVPCPPRNWTLVLQPCCHWAADLLDVWSWCKCRDGFPRAATRLLVNFLSEIGLWDSRELCAGWSSFPYLYWWLCRLSYVLNLPIPQQIIGPEERNWFIPLDPR